MAIGVLLTAGLVALHLVFHVHAGGLFRDEVNAVNVASFPTYGEVIEHIGLDSYPRIWPTLLHAWIQAGLGDTDAGLRRLGLAIGLGTIAVLWWTGRRLRVGPPLVALLLWGMSPSAILYGDAVRGYGLAALAIAWVFGALRAFIAEPTPARFAVAQLAAIVAIQTHYGNGPYLLGIGVAGAAAALVGRRWRTAAAALAIGAIAASTLVVDVPILSYMAHASTLERRDPLGVGWVLRVLGHALAPGVPWLAGAWAAAIAVALVGLGVAARAPRSRRDVEDAVYAGVAVAVGLGVNVGAFARLGIPTLYWHYLSALVLVALGCEVAIALLARRLRAAAWTRVVAVALLAVVAAPAAVRTVSLRMTNLDVAARTLAERSTPDDLIAVFPWVCGITFDHYYRGRAPWITIPDFDEHRFHRHLLVAEKMKLGDDAIRTELDRVERTLRNGGRVWVAGELRAPDAPLVPLPPAPTGPHGWQAGPYLDAWELRFGALVEAHAASGVPVSLPITGSVNAWESLPVTELRGYK